MSDSLRLQTLALIGQEFLLNALANGGSLDSAVANLLLHPQPKTGREISATALTGRIRSDSGAMRQSAKNASEAATMATTIKNATFTMGETLSGMQTIVQSLQGGQMTTVEAQDAFNNLSSNLSALVSGTQYNGISLVDKDGWAADKRLSISGSGDTASISIQMGNAASMFTLRDLSSLKDYAGTDLSTANLNALVTDISTNIGKVNTMSSGFESIAGSYTADAKHLEKQADLLATTAARAIYGTGATTGGGSAESIQSILMDLLLRDQGKIVDTSS